MDVWSFALVNKRNLGPSGSKITGERTPGPALRAMGTWPLLLLSYTASTEVAAKLYSFTPNANVSFKAIEQITSPSAAEETPRTVWGSISSRHGRCIVWIAGVHTNAIRFAQPEGYSGSYLPPSPLRYIYLCSSFTPLVLFLIR